MPALTAGVKTHGRTRRREAGPDRRVAAAADAPPLAALGRACGEPRVLRREHVLLQRPGAAGSALEAGEPRHRDHQRRAIADPRLWRRALCAAWPVRLLESSNSRRIPPVRA